MLPRCPYICPPWGLTGMGTDHRQREQGLLVLSSFPDCHVLSWDAKESGNSNLAAGRVDLSNARTAPILFTSLFTY